jgi:hypothetical protein
LPHFPKVIVALDLVGLYLDFGDVGDGVAEKIEGLTLVGEGA